MSHKSFEPICVETILVPLDASSHSLSALQAAVIMANHYHAKLKGIFIEDITLLSLAEMPFRQEVGEYTAIIREISTDGITRGIFVQSKTIIKTFQRLIRKSDIEGDISILRGKVKETIQEESEQCDLLILGKSGTNPSSMHRMGSTTKAMIQKQDTPLLIVQEGNQLGHPVFVIYDDSPVGKISLETAKELIEAGNTLEVLVNADDSQFLDEAVKWLHEWSKKNTINISIQSFTARSFDHFLRKVEGLKSGLFILPELIELDKRGLVETCLERISLPILLIRTPRRK